MSALPAATMQNWIAPTISSARTKVARSRVTIVRTVSTSARQGAGTAR